MNLDFKSLKKSIELNRKKDAEYYTANITTIQDGDKHILDVEFFKTEQKLTPIPKKVENLTEEQLENEMQKVLQAIQVEPLIIINKRIINSREELNRYEKMDKQKRIDRLKELKGKNKGATNSSKS